MAEKDTEAILAKWRDMKWEDLPRVTVGGRPQSFRAVAKEWEGGKRPFELELFDSSGPYPMYRIVLTPDEPRQDCQNAPE